MALPGIYMPLNREDLATFLSQQLDIDAANLDDDLPLFSSGLLDSTSMVTLVMFLEERTGIMIDGADLTLDNFDTITRILSFCSTSSA